MEIRPLGGATVRLPGGGIVERVAIMTGPEALIELTVILLGCPLYSLLSGVVVMPNMVFTEVLG
jgi:hypothetical protein